MLQGSLNYLINEGLKTFIIQAVFYLSFCLIVIILGHRLWERITQL